EDAVPHIGEAMYMPKAVMPLADYNEAFTKACELGGKQFLVDMFSQEYFASPQPLDEPEMGC
ncbi:hypothetical protein LJC34_07570, partial [Oscillospiraceae bacterium OttesenSCG-928-G22]|nr:hypothetical protein [Oscillospiraceae bacterium OttesenSCG-928-G22]